MSQSFEITVKLAEYLIQAQFPQYADLAVCPVEKQGHDNRTYRLGSELLIRMPTAESYALKVPKEQELLPLLAQRLSLSIPAPIAMGQSCARYPFPFSIYKWLPGKSLNLCAHLSSLEMEQLAFDLSHFLIELQSIQGVLGPTPGQHNWWRGDHISVYDRGAREQIAALSGVIDSLAALSLWDAACKTRWSIAPVWVHGDMAVGNIVLENQRLSAVIDFGGVALGDPACDLVMAWTFFEGASRDLFIQYMHMDEDTWLRAKAWALWKATYELCQQPNMHTEAALLQQRIIATLLK